MPLFGNGDEDSGSRERGGFEDAEAIQSTAKRVVDEEAGVVLYAARYVVGEGAGYGLAAVPLSETDLDVDEE